MHNWQTNQKERLLYEQCDVLTYDDIDGISPRSIDTTTADMVHIQNIHIYNNKDNEKMTVGFESLS